MKLRNGNLELLRDSLVESAPESEHVTIMAGLGALDDALHAIEMAAVQLARIADAQERVAKDGIISRDR